MSGTIRKAEEEAIRRARATILRAQKEASDGIENSLEAILGRGDEEQLDNKERLRKDQGIGESIGNDDDGEEMDSDEDG